MKFLRIDDIKKHLRIDFIDDDAELELYGSVAEDTVLNVCGRTVEDLVEDFGSVPSSLRLAALLLADHYYQYRGVSSPTDVKTVPFGFDMHVKPYMRLGYCETDAGRHVHCTDDGRRDTRDGVHHDRGRLGQHCTKHSGNNVKKQSERK